MGCNRGEEEVETVEVGYCGVADYGTSNEAVANGGKGVGVVD